MKATHKSDRKMIFTHTHTHTMEKWNSSQMQAAHLQDGALHMQTDPERKQTALRWELLHREAL